MNRSGKDADNGRRGGFDPLCVLQPRISSAKREALLDAAVAVFSRDGYDGGKTLDIAQKAGASEATLFKYFGSKRGLLAALGERVADRILKPYLITALERGDTRESPAQSLARILENRMRILEENLPLLRILLAEAPRDPAAFSGMLESALPDVLELADSFHTRYADAGAYRPVDPRLASRTFLSLMLGCVVLSDLLPERFRLGDAKSEAETLAELFLQGIGAR